MEGIPPRGLCSRDGGRNSKCNCKSVRSSVMPYQKEMLLGFFFFAPETQTGQGIDLLKIC